VGVAGTEGAAGDDENSLGPRSLQEELAGGEFEAGGTWTKGVERAAGIGTSVTVESLEWTMSRRRWNLAMRALASWSKIATAPVLERRWGADVEVLLHRDEFVDERDGTGGVAQAPAGAAGSLAEAAMSRMSSWAPGKRAGLGATASPCPGVCWCGTRCT